MQPYIDEGTRRRGGPLREVVAPGVVLAAETVATLAVTVLAVGLLLAATGASRR